MCSVVWVGLCSCGLKCVIALWVRACLADGVCGRLIVRVCACLIVRVGCVSCVCMCGCAVVCVGCVCLVVCWSCVRGCACVFVWFVVGLCDCCFIVVVVLFRGVAVVLCVYWLSCVFGCVLCVCVCVVM